MSISKASSIIIIPSYYFSGKMQEIEIEGNSSLFHTNFRPSRRDCTTLTPHSSGRPVSSRKGPSLLFFQFSWRYLQGEDCTTLPSSLSCPIVSARREDCTILTSFLLVTSPSNISVEDLETSPLSSGMGVCHLCFCKLCRPLEPSSKD